MASSARIDELRRKFDENPRRFFAPLANEYRKAGDAEQALFICQEYLPQQPGHMSGHIVYGQALFDLARYDDARAVFETALALDPENLIALRHLGDIARTMGDLGTARTWYQRVLEADPRNEEIAQLLLSLLSNDATQSLPNASRPTPLADAPVAPAALADTSPPPHAGTDSGYYSDRARNTTGDTAPVSTGESHPTPDESRRVSPHAPNEAELLDLDDFDLGGVPLSELRASSPTPIYQPSQPFDETTASGIEMPPMIESEDASNETGAISGEPTPRADTEIEVDFLTIDVESSPYDSFQPDPFAIAASSFNTGGAGERADDAAIRSSGDESAAPVRDSSIEASPTASADTGAKSSVELSLDSPADTGFEAGFAAWSTSSVPPADTAEPTTEPPVELATDLHLGLTDDAGEEAPVADASPLDGLETFEAGTFHATPFESVTSAADALPIEPFLDVTPPTDGGERVEMDDRASAREPIESDDAASAREPIESDDAASAREPIEAHDVPAAESGAAFEPPPVVDESEDLVALASGENDAELSGASASSAPVAPEAFVTETMADLYLEQGYLEPALAIYRKLVEQRPDDVTLVARMQMIEHRVNGTPAHATNSAAPEAGWDGLALGTAPADGPTIREFLSRLIHRTPPFATSSVASATASDAVDAVDETIADAYAGREDYAFDAYSDIDEPLSGPPAYERPVGASLGTPRDEDAERASDAPPASSTSETIGGSLGALFSGADAAASDAAAAITLSQAFAPMGPDTAPLEGMPAHRAKDELSLDHVFKGNSTPRTAPDGDSFSFDQFFSEQVSDGPAEPRVDPGAAQIEGADDDIAQFNAWLNGLKKT